MQARTDIILDADGDFPIANNTPIGISDRQNVTDCFVSFRGYWKETPNWGVGIGQYLKVRSNMLTTIERAVRMNLNQDGYNVGVQPYVLTNNTLVINPFNISLR